MTIYGTYEDGEIIITFDSRWQNPETLGYKPEDPEYKLLRRLWEEATGETASDKDMADEKTSVLQPKD